MMLGTLAQRRGGSVVASLASIDFVNGAYSVAGVPVTAADIIDQPGLVDPGNGLMIPDQDSAVAMIGDLLALVLTANWTIVVEWEHYDNTGNVYPLVVSGAGDDNSIVLRRYAFSYAMDAQDFAGPNFREATDGEQVLEGVHRVAITRTDAKLAFSIDGRAVVSDTSSSFSLSPTGAVLGDYGGGGIMQDFAMAIRSLRVLAPQADGALPGLSGSFRPIWVPDGATTCLDFVNGRYFAGAAQRPISALLSGGFDASAVSGSGMYINFDNDNRPTPIGAFLSDLVAGLAEGMTVLFEVTTPSSLAGFLLYLGNAAIFGDATSYDLATIDGSVTDQTSLSLSASISGAGAHKIALTFNRDVGAGNHEFAWSHDGNAAVTSTKAYAASSATDAQLGWSGFDGDGQQLFQTYIKTITVYPAMDPADLPALTV
jgi:hypothetical protein